MAGPTTTNFGWQLPDPDGDNQYPEDMATLGSAIDATVATLPQVISALFADRPAASRVGRIFKCTDSSGPWVGFIFEDLGAAWAVKWPQQIVRSYTVSGLILVPSAGSNFLPPFDMTVLGGQAIKFTGVRAYVRSGSITANIQRNASTVAGLSAITINTTKQVFNASGGGVAIADGDSFAPVVATIASGTPDGLSMDFLFSRTA